MTDTQLSPLQQVAENAYWRYYGADVYEELLLCKAEYETAVAAVKLAGESWPPE